MASQGLSSWLSNAEDKESSGNSKDESTDSSLDISLTQLRAKETITRISPEKRALVEEIDSEADDAEFDERAHWARRGYRKKARASRRAKQDKNQPSIALFCVKETTADYQVEDEAEAMGQAVVASQLELNEGSMSVLEAAEIESRKDEKRENSLVVSLVTPEKAEKDSVEEVTPSPVMISGRPKRQAVVRAEILQQQQKLLDAVAARNNAASFLTPPPTTKKADASAKSSGRKRKLEMNKKKTSPSTKSATSGKSPSSKAAQSFFLNEEEKKQLQEIEAVSLFREQLRQTREKDKAFFDGKTVNPFFQARTMKRSSSVENDDGSIEICDDEGEESGEAKRTGGGSWSKQLSLFPDVQLVLPTSYTVKDVDMEYPALPKKSLPVDAEIIDVDALPDSSLLTETMNRLKAAANGQVTTESSFSEQFWFREFLDASGASCSSRVDVSHDNVIDIATVDDHVGRPVTEMETTTETEEQLIEELVDVHGMRENYVRELFAGLEQAKAKRLDRVQNLSLVDRYAPVNASGLVGNHEVTRILSSWLSAWKIGGDDRARRDCFESELFTFDDGDSDSEDEVGDLCRLFILDGESGSGKSAAVYACAEELGYEIIEINAAQNRSGKSIVELAGEATQSTRVLHIGGKDDKGKKKHKKKRRRHSEGRRSLDQPTAASSSLVLFEDVDLVFDEDKGFLNALCSIAKHSKCPIVVTCAQLPDAFPPSPGRLCRTMQKPSHGEFATWMRLVSFIEGLTVAPALVDALGNFFERDVRRSLHFLEAYLPASNSASITNWRWLQKNAAKDEDCTFAHIDVPAWTVWRTRSSSFDAMTSNLLAELKSAAEVAGKCQEDKSREEKEDDAAAMSELAHVLDAASLADTWMTCDRGVESEDYFFLKERRELAGLELRRSSLYMLEDELNPLGASLLRGKEVQAPASVCVQRTLDEVLAASRRYSHREALAELKPKFDLPLAYKGCGNSEARFTLDYMPMVGRLASSTGLQEGRRRTSRRNHYLGDVLGDMSLLDELPSFNTYLQADEDQVVAASQDSSE